MEIQFNNQPIQLDAPVSVAEFLIQTFHGLPGGVAVAINNSVIARDAWADTQLNNADKLVVIKATQGG